MLNHNVRPYLKSDFIKSVQVEFFTCYYMKIYLYNVKESKNVSLKYCTRGYLEVSLINDKIRYLFWQNTSNTDVWDDSEYVSVQALGPATLMKKDAGTNFLRPTFSQNTPKRLLLSTVRIYHTAGPFELLGYPAANLVSI